MNHYYPFGLTMGGISDKAAGGIENKYKYNGIELDTSLGLNEYEAALRDLDPQTGRWWQVDPETEDQEMWSPYTSNNDNPILYKDPRGNEGEACCQWLSDIVTTVVATTSVAVDNTLGTNLTGAIANSGYISPSSTNTWNNAVTTANQTSLVAGTASVVVGGGIAAGGEGATLATGGLSSEVTVPAAAAGLGVAAAGTWVAANATKNLQKGNGLIRDKNRSSSSTDKPYSKKEARENARQQRENQPASENYAKHKAKELEKTAGKDARRNAHDKKESGSGDRNKKQLNEDYKK